MQVRNPHQTGRQVFRLGAPVELGTSCPPSWMTIERTLQSFCLSEISKDKASTCFVSGHTPSTIPLPCLAMFLGTEVLEVSELKRTSKSFHCFHSLHLHPVRRQSSPVSAGDAFPLAACPCSRSSSGPCPNWALLLKGQKGGGQSGQNRVI